MLENYVKFSDITEEIKTKYESALPSELLTIWKEQGFGSFMNGFFNQTVGFIEQFVFNKKNWQVDVTFTDPDFDLAKPWAFTPKDLYK